MCRADCWLTMTQQEIRCPVCNTQLQLPVAATCPICTAELPDAVKLAVVQAQTSSLQGAPSPAPSHAAGRPLSQPAVPPPAVQQAPSVPLNPAVSSLANLPKPSTVASTAWPGSPLAAATHPPIHATSTTFPVAPPSMPLVGMRPAPPTIPLTQTPWPNGGATKAPAGSPGPSSWTSPPAALGALESTHRLSIGGPVALALISGLFVVVGVAGAASASGNDTSNGLVCAGTAIVVCVLSIVAASTGSQSSLAVYSNGIVITRPSKKTMALYDDVKNLWYRGRRSARWGHVTTSQITIELNNSQRLSIEATRYTDSGPLADRLIQNFTTPLLARSLVDLAANRSLSFGPIQVDQHGMSNGREMLPWADVSDIQMSGATLSIKKRGKWLAWSNISTERTPNVLVLLVIVHALGGKTP